MPLTTYKGGNVIDPILQMRKSGSEEDGNLLRVSQLISGDAGIQNQFGLKSKCVPAWFRGLRYERWSHSYHISLLGFVSFAAS